MNNYKDAVSGLQIVYPSGWILEKSESGVVLFDPINGYGAINFSLYRVSEDSTVNHKEQLDEFLKANNYSAYTINEGEYSASVSVQNSDRYWQYWLFDLYGYLVLASYNCEIEDIGKERNDVSDIVSSAFPYNAG